MANPLDADPLDRDALDRDIVEQLRELMADDFGALVAAFLADSAARMTDIEAALVGPNHHKLRRATHSLKGMCLNMGAQPLATLLAELEAAARVDRTEAFPPLWAAVHQEYARARSAAEALTRR